MSISISLIALTMAMQTQVSADEQDSSAAIDISEAVDVVEPVNEEADDARIICKRTAVIGSKFKKKLCGTVKEWKIMEGRSRDTAKKIQSRGKGLSPNGG